MTERMFHLVEPAAFDAAGAQWSPPSLAAQGFVHLSFPAQLEGTLAVHYADAGELYLLEVELQDADQLRVEPSREGALFPHLYRPLAKLEVVRHWRLPPAAASKGDSSPNRTSSPNRNRGLPTFGSTPVLDDPPGRSGVPRPAS